MKTVDTVFSFLTSVSIVEYLKNTLMEKDPEFPAAAKQFQKVVEELAEKLPEGVLCDLMIAWDQQIQSDLIFAAYQGFQTNLANFHNPVATQFTRLDYETFLREHIMQTMPRREEAEQDAKLFTDAFYNIVAAYEEDIRNYYVHLEVTGPKLAHYWGYCFANLLLPWVEPGYVSDGAQTSLYTMELRRDLGFHLD